MSVGVRRSEDGVTGCSRACRERTLVTLIILHSVAPARSAILFGLSFGARRLKAPGTRTLRVPRSKGGHKNSI
jgi:hypothetical protein